MKDWRLQALLKQTDGKFEKKKVGNREHNFCLEESRGETAQKKSGGKWDCKGERNKTNKLN